MRGRAEEMKERQPEKQEKGMAVGQSEKQAGRAAEEQMVNQFGKVSRFAVHAEKREGRTILSDISFTAPYKLMAPFEKPDGGIQIMPLCASAGIMRGDRQEFSYEAGEGADLEVLSQSFEKIHRMDGGSAYRHIGARAEKGSSLYCCPQPVIPFAGSAYDSETEIYLADRSTRLFWLEIICSGRIAHEEQFAFRRFSSLVRIYREGKLIYRDNTRYEPDRMPMRGLGMYEGYTHLANIFLSASFGDLREPIWEMIEKETECEGGVTLLPGGDLAVRIFGNRAQLLEKAAAQIKGLARKGIA